MRKVAAIALVLLVLGSAGSAHADALFDLSGAACGISLEFTGTLGIEGIDRLFDLQEGQRYNWFYDLTYTTYEGDFLGTRSHSGFADCTLALHETTTAGDQIVYSLAGDDGSFLTNIGQDTRWRDPFTGELTFAGLRQRNVQAVPEPSTMLLLASGLMGVGLFRRKSGSSVSSV